MSTKQLNVMISEARQEGQDDSSNNETEDSYSL